MTAMMKTRRLALTAMVIASMSFPTWAQAQETVRIGLATQAWWPTVVAETASRLGLFEKEGLAAELTVYQSGGETFTALAADAADIISIQPDIVATGRMRGVEAKMVAKGADANYGWHLMVPEDSEITDVAQLDGTNVGITASGSLSDFLAMWTAQDKGVSFNTVPLGGGGLAPNLISGNVEAAVVFSPLSFQLMHDGDGRSILDFGEEIPPHLNSGWAAPDTLIDSNPDLIQRTLNALYGAVAYLQANEEEAIALLAELNQIDEEVAALEYQEQFLRLSADGIIDVSGAEAASELAEIGGRSEMAPAGEVVDTSFEPVPTEH